MARVRLQIENLGSRRLPSATLVNGVLTVDGTEAADVIVVRQVGDTISVRGMQIDLGGNLVSSVNVQDVSQIEVNAFGGSDRIVLTGVTVGGIVHAGNGADMIFGGDGADDMDGDNGNDTIVAGAGNDTMDGGAGNDRLKGQDGNDQENGGIGEIGRAHV